MLSVLRRRTLLGLAPLTLGLALAGPAAQAALIDLPPIDRITRYAPKLPLQVFTADGVEIAQFGAERRIYLPLAQTPKLMQDALLAIEDTRFREHGGVDAKGMARAALALITGGRKQGASTITQQLVRTMLLTRELSIERKTKEIMLAFKVEEALSKDRILEIYMNEIFLGQRAYGFEAAAQTYFGKSLGQLSVAETAMLAGLPQNPYYANPVANFERATQRQRVVLQRMREVGVIDDAQLQAARAEKLVIRPPGQRSIDAAHVAEMARRVVFERFGEGAYSSGIRVTTSLLAADQRAATAALQRGVLAQDRRTGWRGPEAHESLPQVQGAELERAAAEALKEVRDDDLLRAAIVLSASPREVLAQLASGTAVRISGEGLQWVKAGLSAQAKDKLKIQRGAVIRVMKTGKTWSITQWPEAEAALVAMDTHTGRVRALVGGFDFSRQPFNHVTQGWRQPGSTIKPLLYSAALEARVMPGTLVEDRPFTAANGWSPGNSGAGSAEGLLSLRQALAQSNNLVSVRVLQHTGTTRARDWLGRFGLEVAKQPDNLTLALGTGQVTPLQMARAYSTLANGGWSLDPVVIEKITDAKGKTLFEAPPPAALTEDNRAIPTRNAFVMNSLLADVTRVGTAARVQTVLRRPDLHGKTGTTNDVLDAWFAGYQPGLAAVVWMGYDQPRSLGDHGSGARLALPIWLDYMGAALKGSPVLPPSEAPPGLVRFNDDWLYAEWAAGGAVASIEDSAGAQLAGPPTLIDAIRELFKP
ncbi:PBP1A family penicillin-binding protein [Hydrogenophaga sp.]|uniref:penicillin-binding protein 1A n=1 Tax=Hydrogenophaga sp. TaxID=1904254 RepID=UPI00286EAE69|nr:PBP1A family penicillin-binding protein [Hydrogenophaga sp.]